MLPYYGIAIMTYLATKTYPHLSVPACYMTTTPTQTNLRLPYALTPQSLLLICRPALPTMIMTQTTLLCHHARHPRAPPPPYPPISSPKHPPRCPRERRPVSPLPLPPSVSVPCARCANITGPDSSTPASPYTYDEIKDSSKYLLQHYLPHVSYP
jgi:hypothetical protein